MSAETDFYKIDVGTIVSLEADDGSRVRGKIKSRMLSGWVLPIKGKVSFWITQRMWDEKKGRIEQNTRAGEKA